MYREESARNLRGKNRPKHWPQAELHLHRIRAERMLTTNIQKEDFILGSQQNNGNPVFRLCINGAAVTVRFSEEESADVKCRVRNILTRAYGERIQKELLPCGDAGQTE